MRCTAGRSFGTFGQVPFHVQRQVIGAGEAALAHFAPERLGAGVFAIVARQLVAARETPLTLGPVTPVRLLSYSMVDQTAHTHKKNKNKKNTR